MRTNVACQQFDHLAATDLGALGARLRGEQLVKLVERDSAALELRPGIGFRIGGIDAADEIARQAGFRLEPVECFERARSEHPAEIPDDCLNHETADR